MNHDKIAHTLMQRLRQACREHHLKQDRTGVLALGTMVLLDLLPDDYLLAPETPSPARCANLRGLLAAWRKLPAPDDRSGWIWATGLNVLSGTLEDYEEQA